MSTIDFIPTVSLDVISLVVSGCGHYRGQIEPRCSSATTLIMQWLEFSDQELSKRPDMIGQSSGHARGSVAPLGLDQSRGGWFLLRQRYTQTHMRPGEVVEGLKENHAPPHLGAILTEASALTHERR